MALREFKCSNEHVTEKVLHGEADQDTMEITCQHPVVYSHKGNIACGQPAYRLEVPSNLGALFFVKGSGGFYAPNK